MDDTTLSFFAMILSATMLIVLAVSLSHYLMSKKVEHATGRIEFLTSTVEELSKINRATQKKNKALEEKVIALEKRLRGI